MAISLRRLKVFIAVADHGSVTEAGRALNLTVSAATKSIKELEGELGVRLLARTGEGMRLTRFGESFYLRAKMALAELELAREEIAEMRGGSGAALSIGVLPDGHPLVASGVAKFLQKRGDTNVSIRGGTFEAHVAATRSGDMDFFFGAGLDRESVTGLVTEILAEDDLLIVVRPGHRLLERGDLQLKDLIEERWLLPNVKSPLWTMLTDAIKSEGLELPQGWVEVHAFPAWRTILLETDMISPTSRMRVQEELKLGLLVALPIDFPNLRLAVGVVRRERDQLSSSAKALLGVARALAREFSER